MNSKIGFEISLIVAEEIRGAGRCASFMILTATVPDIFGGQTNSSILVLDLYRYCFMSMLACQCHAGTVHLTFQ